MTSTTLTKDCTGASRLYGAVVGFGWVDTNLGAGMAKRQIPVIGHPSTTRRPQEVSH